jgi:ParB-like chromosome segregation protein Spo0J
MVKKKSEAPIGIVIHQPVPYELHHLNPAPYNPRKIKPEMLAALKQSIREVGFIDPIVVQRDGLIIVGGHQRVRALKEACIELGIAIPKIPCIVLDLTDRQAKKLNMQLNRVGGEFDPRLLGELLASINEEEKITIDEAQGMGFTIEEVGKHIHLVEPVDIKPDEETTSFARSVTLSLQFNDVRMRDAVKKALAEKSETAKKTNGEFIAELLGLRLSA